MMVHCLVEPFYIAASAGHLVEVQGTDVRPFCRYH